jgi:hypothetical protein
MMLHPLEKPTWRTGLIKKIYAVPLGQRYELLFVVILLLLQVSLLVFGMFATS